MASALVHSPPTSPSAAAEPSDAKKARIEPEPSTSAAVPLPTVSKKADKKKQRKAKTGRRLMPDEAVMMDIEVFLGKHVVAQAVEQGLDWEAPAELSDGVEVELRVGKVGSGGDGLSLYSSPDEPSRSWAVVTPFALPGELIRVRVRQKSRLFSKSDLLEVIESSEFRIPEEDIRCQYFGKCGGCQFQNITYDTQLLWKRETVKNAFAHFSKLNPDLIPDVLPTIPSPKTFGYRTKITPHFSSLPAPIRKAVLKQAGIPIPGKHAKAVALPAAVVPDEDAEMADANAAGEGAELDGGEETVEVVVPKGGPPGGGHGPGNRFFLRQHDDKFGKTDDYEFKIGFDERGGRSVMDIEQCILATPVINKHYTQERLTTAANIALFPRNSTLLLRDSADPRSFDPESGVAPNEESNICVTDHKATMHERVGSFHFTFPAGSFFQNNNSILVPLTSYVRDAIFPSTTTSSLHGVPVTTYPPPTHLVDTYCGSGLFGITLSEHFEVVTGVEIDPKSIAYAKANAKLNGVQDKCSFLAGKSEEIFAGVGGFPWEKTAIVLDPPRKGCDEPFLKQLIEFHPQTVVYVSCNVHTQARDIGYLLSTPLADGRKYVLESLRGFDLFPQTAHVEGVAVLRLVEVVGDGEMTSA